MSVEPNDQLDLSNQPDLSAGEAIPLPEQHPEVPYIARPEVEALIPKTPEVLRSNLSPATVPSSAIDNTMLVVPPPPGSPEGIGGILLSPETMIDDPRVRGFVDGLGAAPEPRPASRELFKAESDEQPSDTILKQLVTNQRLRDLWHQMDALQEEVIQNVRAERSMTDAYQQDLLYASTLLLNSAANYDDAREIVYRVRGDLARERKVFADIRRWRPPIAVYYAAWTILVVLASRLDPQFRALVPESIPIMKLAFTPILFAVLGALFNGIMALISHSTVRRDFDPLYVSWYLINPMIGGLLGLIVFVFFVVTGTSFTPTLVSDPSMTNAQTPLVIWLLAFIVGWQQNTAVQLLNGFLKTISINGKPPQAEDRPAFTATPSGSSAPPKPPVS
ncbi:MAG: hypothetical protein ABI947_24510 [Chloroflexota bacterium]